MFRICKIGSKRSPKSVEIGGQHDRSMVRNEKNYPGIIPNKKNECDIGSWHLVVLTRTQPIFLWGQVLFDSVMEGPPEV